MMISQHNFITITNIQAAPKRLDGIAHRTPVLTSRTVNQRMNSQVFFKCKKFHSKAMYQAGYEFYCSDNNVWLVDNVPPEYLQNIKIL